MEFSIHDTGRGFAVITNLDYVRLNELYHQRVPVQHSSITSEYLQSFLQDARADTYFAAHYLAEIVTLPILSDLIRLKHFEFLRPRENSDSQLELFKEVAIGDFPSIREVINSGERTFPEFLQLVRMQNDLENGYMALIQTRTCCANTKRRQRPIRGRINCLQKGSGLQSQPVSVWLEKQ